MHGGYGVVSRGTHTEDRPEIDQFHDAGRRVDEIEGFHVAMYHVVAVYIFESIEELQEYTAGDCVRVQTAKVWVQARRGLDGSSF